MKKLLASPLFNVLCLSVGWALQIFVAKLAFRAGAELFTFSIQSLFFICLFLAFYILPKKYDKLKKLPAKTIFFLIGIGAIGAGLGGTLSNAGVQLTTATNAGFLFQFDIALTILIAWFVLKEKLDLPKIVTLVLILLGTFLLTTNGQLIVPHLGDSFILLASTAFAIATVLTRKALKGQSVDPDMVSFIRPVAGFFILLCVVWIAQLFPKETNSMFATHLFDFNHIGYVILNALCCISNLIFLNRTLQLASASYTAMMAAVTPILVAILGTIFLSETLTPLQFVGALFIISTSFVTHFLKVDKH
jgi:drug/metabolite transporter (DMT)-like permease